MLQWMGGSRRNVATSRKSTQKRQKQYFQQKKHLQQQTAGYDNNTDPVNIFGQYHEKPKSLDILSFMNIATVAQECKSSLTNEKSEETNASPEKCHFLNSSPPTPSLIARTILKHAAQPKEATDANLIGREVEHVSPRKDVPGSPVNKPSSHNHYSYKNGDTLDNHNTETDHQLSVLDLLGDDEPNENSSGVPVHEAHVAFSVEGLGKMGIGTPVHSPRQPGRFSQPNSTRKCQSFKNHSYKHDLGLELNSMIHDIDMPPRESKRMNVEGSMPHDAHLLKKFNFFSDEESPYTNFENERPCKAVPGFLDENFSMKRMHDATWKNQAYYMDNIYADSSSDEKDNVSDFTFEYSYLTNKRDVAEELRDFNTFGSHTRPQSPASYFTHVASAKDHDFLNLETKRYPAVNETWDFSPSTWSSFPVEDGTDNMSLLSEESTSSVRGGKAKYSAPSSLPGKSSVEYYSEFCTNNANDYSNRDMYVEETVFKDMDRKYRENLNASGKHTRMTNTLRTKPTDPHGFNKDFDSLYSRLVEGRFTSVDLDSGQLDQLNGSFHRTSTNSDSLECKYLPEDLFGVFPSSSLYLNEYSSCKKSKLDAPVNYAVSSSSLFTEKAPNPKSFHYYGSPSSLNIGSKSRKPDITQASRIQFEPPPSYGTTGDQGDIECPGEGDILECGDGESEIQPSAFGSSPKERDEEFSVGKTDSFSENGKTVDAPCCNGDSEGMEAENETPEHSGQPVTQVCPEYIEATPAKVEVPKELERCMDDNKYQLDGCMHLPYQLRNKGNVDKEDSGSQVNSESKEPHSKNPSYQVMLESYVLQLLCVQKVLRESSEQDSVKKFV